MVLNDRILIVSLVFAVSLRMVLLVSGHVALQKGTEQSELRQRSVQRFDPDALVVITPGPDGAPGQRGIDDGGNGTTDEPGELGATGSDDVCMVVTRDFADGNDWLVLQHGAFRDTRPDETIPGKTPVRRLVRSVDQNGIVREWIEDEIDR